MNKLTLCSRRNDKSSPAGQWGSVVRSNVVMTRVIGVRMGVAVDIRTIIDYKKYSLSESVKYYFNKKI